jgi:hypothetical protein
VQESLLRKNPSAHLRVYAIWVNKYLFAARDRWDSGGLADPRVLHLWDENDLSGVWFVRNLRDFRGGIWDSYLLFGPEAEWDTLPAPLLSSGSTVIGERNRLAAAIDPLLLPNGG